MQIYKIYLVDYQPYSQGFQLAVKVSSYLFQLSLRPQQNAISPTRLSREGMKLSLRQKMKFFLVSSSNFFFTSISLTLGGILYYILSPPWMNTCRNLNVILIYFIYLSVFSVILWDTCAALLLLYAIIAYIKYYKII